MKFIRYTILTGGLVFLTVAIGFIFRFPLVTQFFWPWPDGRLSYLFVGSILAAASAAMLWIGWTGELSAVPAGSLNIFVIGVTTAFSFFQLAFQEGRTDLISFGITAFFMAVAGGASFLWSRQLPLKDSRPMPSLVRISFVIFSAVLVLAGLALVFRASIFPWALKPDSSVIFGCIFIGDAFYFLWGLRYPRWHNALGQLLSFLVYDLVLIVPFLSLFRMVEPQYVISLVIYVAALIYSGAIAVYFLLINPQTRFGS